MQKDNQQCVAEAECLQLDTFMRGGWVVFEVKTLPAKTTVFRTLRRREASCFIIKALAQHKHLTYGFSDSVFEKSLDYKYSLTPWQYLINGLGGLILSIMFMLDGGGLSDFICLSWAYWGLCRYWQAKENLLFAFSDMGAECITARRVEGISK